MRKKLEFLRTEVESTIKALNSLEYFNTLLNDQNVVDIVNKNYEFWRIYEKALITQVFVGIRRLFESKKDTFNFQNFMLFCKSNISDFSYSSLESRKLALHQERPDWLSEYMKDVPDYP